MGTGKNAKSRKQARSKKGEEERRSRGPNLAVSDHVKGYWKNYQALWMEASY